MAKVNKELASYAIGETVSWNGLILKVIALNEDGSVECLSPTMRVQLSDVSTLHKEPTLNATS